MDQAHGQRRSPAHDHPSFFKSLAFKLGMLNQEQEDSGHAEEKGDLLGFKQLQGPGRFRSALDDHRAAHVQHGQGEKTDAPDMKHG